MKIAMESKFASNRAHRRQITSFESNQTKRIEFPKEFPSMKLLKKKSSPPKFSSLNLEQKKTFKCVVIPILKRLQQS
jgi:hypothetical protein